MKIKEFIEIIRGKINLRILEAVIAVLSMIIGVYLGFFRDISPLLKYEILSNTNIVNIKEDVKGLSIIYNKEDIRKTNKSLSVIVVRISNEGLSPIRKGDYDRVSPLGININPGQIITAEIISATKDYLRDAPITVRDSSNVEFSQSIINPNESFVVKMLILSQGQSILKITPTGTIAGVKKPILDDQSDHEKISFIEKVTMGSLSVQIARILTYGIGFIIVMIIIIVPSVFISSNYSQWKRMLIVKQFKSHTTSDVNKMNVNLYDYYTKDKLNIIELKQLKKICKDNFSLDEFIQRSKTDISPLLPGMSRYYRVRPILMQHLGLISEEGEKYFVNEERVEAMNEFLDFMLQKQKG
ncbi:MAG: hypothetical protein CSYNP_04167 [Syntrophus sp. SKADARSKE-3]|nr:hypothetical protein [Syntrophus sp. SKADARSKE-3]